LKAKEEDQSCLNISKQAPLLELEKRPNFDHIHIWKYFIWLGTVGKKLLRSEQIEQRIQPHL
jgi:hypothetical protein